jgi:protoporphyrin/coproporphyrin ferrochelatase
VNEAAKNSTAVLLLAHGSPDSPTDVPRFLLKVTGGRALPTEVIEEVQRRYETIGTSPLTALTLKQGELLSAKLQLPVYVGMRNWHPFVSQTIERMIGDGVKHAIVICLAPQNSRTSVGLYRTSLRVSSDPGLTFDFIESWHDHPRLIQAFADNLKAGRAKARRECGRDVPIIFTAHSVPTRTILEGDPYEIQARHTAELVAKAAFIDERDWRFAFQSQGMTGAAWLGPTVEATIMDLKRGGYSGVFIQPIGFLCDHVEILYDIDVVFKTFAEEQGMRLWRAESLNDSPLLTAALAELAKSRMAASKSA